MSYTCQSCGKDGLGCTCGEAEMTNDMDGFEVCRRLKASPETTGIPVVFLTALGEEKDVEQGLALGGDGYVVKPFNAVTLAAQISELLTEDSDEAV